MYWHDVIAEISPVAILSSTKLELRDSLFMVGGNVDPYYIPYVPVLIFVNVRST